MSQELCANCAEGMTLTKLACEHCGWEPALPMGRERLAAIKNDYIRTFRPLVPELRVAIADHDIEG